VEQANGPVSSPEVIPVLTNTFSLTLKGGMELHFNIVAEENSISYKHESGEERRRHWWDGAAFLTHGIEPGTKRIVSDQTLRMLEGYHWVDLVEAKCWSAWVHQQVTEGKARRAAAREAMEGRA
jgi:hypothetical protein